MFLRKTLRIRTVKRIPNSWVHKTTSRKCDAVEAKEIMGILKLKERQSRRHDVQHSNRETPAILQDSGTRVLKAGRVPQPICGVSDIALSLDGSFHVSRRVLKSYIHVRVT